MELIRNLKEKHVSSKQNDYHHRAEELITLSDFGNQLYVAYSGIPLVLIDPQWATEEIVEQLRKIRQNYVNAMMKN